MKRKYLFGPVPSRRLGYSLGVDIVPYKTCTLDCVYCECGKTTKLRNRRSSYVSASDVIRELSDYLSKEPKLDYITFSGGGEPVLNTEIGKIIEFIKTSYDAYKVALLTNGTLFGDKKAREDVSMCDLIIPSVDAASEKAFKKINRPAPGISASSVIKGIELLNREVSGKLWVEVFVIPGINDNEGELRKIKEALIRIGPEKVQLNTLDRPGTVKDLKSAGREKLLNICEYFSPLKTEIIGRYGGSKKRDFASSDMKEKMLLLLSRRPCTLEDLSEVFSPQKNDLEKYLKELKNSGRIQSSKGERGLFYRAPEEENKKAER